MKIKLSRSQWEEMGKKAGWGVPQQNNSLDINRQLVEDYKSLSHSLKMNREKFPPEAQIRIQKLPDPDALPGDESFVHTIKQALAEAQQIYSLIQ